MPRFRPVVAGVHALVSLPVGVHVHLLRHGGDLALVDTGYRGAAGGILAALEALGHGPRDLAHILVTHYHTDHTGSLAALSAATGARVYMSAREAPVVRSGGRWPPLEPHGLLGRVMLPLLAFDPHRADPAPVHHELQGGETLPLAGGVRVLPTPGHTAGHCSFLWGGAGGVLFTGDAASHLPGGPGLALFNEDNARAGESFRGLGRENFETACFGHGPPLVKDAAAAFRRAARD